MILNFLLKRNYILDWRGVLYGQVDSSFGAKVGDVVKAARVTRMKILISPDIVCFFQYSTKKSARTRQNRFWILT